MKLRNFYRLEKLKKRMFKLFYHRQLKTLPNPGIINDMEKSSKRALQAISKKQKIGIFGDYDVDGASASALLANYFNKINVLFKFIYQIEKRRLWTNYRFI